ncbi:MAG: type I-E CRISPR-associated protein Cas5/CasD [Clostridiales bacterium]|jgi:CRISPR system Cascade subunit CasD|nr:type I-E CRISPR-associated protein Cas5/CasD [Clostridiales bacterium]
MKTLLLRLAAPLQSWGADSKFERRTTMREPTKSGVIGMIAAAMGRGRDENIEDLAELGFGVRIDQPGQMLRDFHTAQVLKEKHPRITDRFYLSDAIFLVALEGNEDLLHEIEQALLNPVFPLYLGRRSCPPSGRLVLGLRDKSLKDALLEEAWQAASFYQKRFKTADLTIVIDAKQPGALRRPDLPISFSQTHKKYAYRYIEDIPAAVRMGD